MKKCMIPWCRLDYIALLFYLGFHCHNNGYWFGIIYCYFLFRYFILFWIIIFHLRIGIIYFTRMFNLLQSKHLRHLCDMGFPSFKENEFLIFELEEHSVKWVLLVCLLRESPCQEINHSWFILHHTKNFIELLSWRRETQAFWGIEVLG